MYVGSVEEKWSNEELKRAAHEHLRDKLKNNGYRKIPKPNIPRRQPNRQKENTTLLQIDFISDSCNRKIAKMQKSTTSMYL